jgi:hypothetical protein
MAPPTGFPLLRGIRPVAGDAATLLAKRLPTRLPKSQMTDQMMAIDPLRVVLSGYGDRADEALARAKLFQEKEPLQYLTEGRWYDNPAAGLGGQEMPLLTYPGSVIPGTKGGIEGLFRLEPDRPSASIQIAMGAADPRSVLLEEARHGIDRMLVPGEKAPSFRAPSAFAELLSGSPYDKAEKYMEYFSQPSEVRATLSGLLAESPEFISTRPQAEALLEQALSGGSLREQATAEALLNNQRLRNEYIPYLLKALSAGGLLAGNNLLEEEP